VWCRHLAHPGHPSLARLISNFPLLVIIKTSLRVCVILANVAAMFGCPFLVPLYLHIFHSK
jgi:hypothetical protein